MKLVVVKLGGSLLSCPDLAERLRAILSQWPEARHLIVVGGGPAADVVRGWSRDHSLPEEVAHWVAVRSLSLSRLLVRHLLPESREVSSREAAQALWSEGHTPLLLGVEAYLREAEAHDSSPLPHRWDVTSDSIAAWVAHRWTADELMLLKSVNLPAEIDAVEAARQELVDPFFPTVAEKLPRVSWCNLRESTPAARGWLAVR